MRRLRRDYVGLLVMLTMLILGGYLQTTNVPYADYKITWFGLAVVMGTLAALRGVNSKEMLLAMVGVNGLLLLQYLSVFGSRDWILIGETYQYLSLIAGFCAVYWLNRTDKLTWWGAALAALNIFVLLNSGSRTPLLGVGAVLLYQSLFNRDARPLLLIAAASAIALTYVDYTEFRLFQRLSYLSEDTLDGSSLARLDFWQLTLDAPQTFFSSLFGHGTGMWPANILSSDEGYPHNIFLEFFYEHGLLGLLVMGYVTYLLLSARNSVFKYLGLYFLVFLQLSGGLESMRWFMLFFALALHHTGENEA
ncbi:O-antigen ligase family protein [Deinococcus radiophilus]|nr:O-antigen ligase family protein [Deinococcus radiophilus]UFA49662.1 O-antigen ligase family protein [Deinococcus radiophilus]